MKKETESVQKETKTERKESKSETQFLILNGFSNRKTSKIDLKTPHSSK
jgi:hypothetical protein